MSLTTIAHCEIPGSATVGDFILSNQALKHELREVAHLLGDAARKETLKYFRSNALDTSNKDNSGGFDPVTYADRASERVMRDILATRRPDDGIIGEEFGTQEGSSGLTWVLDPIDGTRAYICGASSWGVLISVEQDRHPILGLIDQPYTQERFEGGFGQSSLDSRLGQSPLKVRTCENLSDAILLTTFPEIGTDAERRSFEAVRDRVKLTRYGLDCYGYALLALGQVDLVIEAGLSRYDISAPIAVVEAAGGVVTNWQGNPIEDGGQVIAACDKEVHSQALEVLNT